MVRGSDANLENFKHLYIYQKLEFVGEKKAPLYVETLPVNIFWKIELQISTLMTSLCMASYRVYDESLSYYGRCCCHPCLLDGHLGCGIFQRSKETKLSHKDTETKSHLWEQRCKLDTEEREIKNIIE
jgi:hypothetical protein